MLDKSFATGYPSEFVPPNIKQQKQWCLQNVEAHHYEDSGTKPTDRPSRRRNSTYTRMRAYARGQQSQNQYKESLCFTSEENKKKNINVSYRNVNFEILKVVPKIRGVLVNKMVNQRLNMRCLAIDPVGISIKRQQKAKLLEFIINKEAIEAFEKLTEMQLEKPVAEGEEPPMNMNEVDPYVDMNPKDIACMEVIDFLRQNFYENDWDQLGEEIAGDLVDCGVGGTIQFIDVDNKIKFRRIDPERCITNKCIYPDFRDMKRFGEYVEMTVGDLKKETRGMFTDERYQEIANKYSDGAYKGPATEYLKDDYSYTYDREKVLVLNELWYSVDTETHVEFKNEAGNTRVKRHNANYVPFKGDPAVNGGNGLSDEEYAMMNGGKKQILRTQVKNVYRCSWVVGTDIVYNFGLLPNMLRSASNPQDTVMPVVLISTDFMSTMELIEQPEDQVQLNYLQFQNHIAASKPPGIAIEMHALAGLSRNKTIKLDPKEAIQQYVESGNIIYNGRDQHGNPLQQMPFMELRNGLSEGAAQHFSLILQFIDLIKNMVGLNALTEGQAPPERLQNGVAQLSWGAADNALSHLNRAYKKVYERTGRNLFYLLQNNIQRMNPEDLMESLGGESYKYFMLNNDLALRDMGIKLEEGPDDQTREKVSQLLQLMVEGGQIPGEDAIMIEMMENPYKQIQMIRKHRLEMQKQKAAEQENVVRAQGEEQTKMNLATEQAKQQGMQQEQQAKAEEQAQLSEAKKEEILLKGQVDMMLKKFEVEAGLVENKEKLANDLLKTMMQEQSKLRIAKAKPKPKAVAKK